MPGIACTYPQNAGWLKMNSPLTQVDFMHEAIERQEEAREAGEKLTDKEIQNQFDVLVRIRKGLREEEEMYNGR